MYVTRSGHGLIHNFGNRSSHVVKATVMTMRLFTAQLLSDEPPPICIGSSRCGAEPNLDWTLLIIKVSKV